jgi:transposase
MKKIARIGLDLAKNVFQVHAVDYNDKKVHSKAIKRGKLLEYFSQCEPCLIGMEACASAHHWARELMKCGHEVHLIAAQFVAPYRKSGKNDANDAEAICEALSRPGMRFVPVKTVEQQAILSVHRSRSLLIGERTALVNHLRGLLAEFGLVMPKGFASARRELPGILEDAENGIPELARDIFADGYRRLCQTDKRISEYDARIKQIANNSESTQRIMKVEGIGPLTATAITASIGNGSVFNNSRQFSAWLGLTPRQNSSGGKARLGKITKRGDVYLRTLLIHGARSALLKTPSKEDKKSRWVESLKARRNQNVAAVALASKNARIIWSMLANGTDYRVAA